MDTDGHGTHCAGTIGAQGDNNFGVVGVAQQVSIMGCKFLHDNRGSTADALECLNYAIDKGVKISSKCVAAPGLFACVLN
jgi:subtilisin family serine protease